MQYISLEWFEDLLLQTKIKLSNNDKIAVAVSGGADSLVLTLLLSQLAQKHNLSLTALTIDHQLRQGSADEASYVGQILSQYKINHKIIPWIGTKPTYNIQAKARTKRYHLLEEWCFNNNCRYLFLGHHFDDQLETFMFRLRRNSGILGLGCMRPVLRKQRCTVVRPLLSLNKSCLLNSIDKIGIHHVNDPSNQSTVYERVFWRQQQLNKIIPRQLFQYFFNIRQHTENWVNRYLYDNAKLSSFGYMTLDKTNFFYLSNFFQRTIMAYILRGIGTNKYPIRNRTLDKVITAITSKNFKSITAGGIQIIAQNDQYLFIREYHRITDVIDLSSAKTEKTLWDNRFIVSNCPNYTGLIKPLGENGWKQMLQHYPQLKNTRTYKPALWSTPALWVKDKIKLEENIVYHQLIQKKGINNKEMYFFSHNFPFHTLFFS